MWKILFQIAVVGDVVVIVAVSRAIVYFGYPVMDLVTLN
jgi:hypothetical protein